MRKFAGNFLAGIFFALFALNVQGLTVAAEEGTTSSEPANEQEATTQDWKGKLKAQIHIEDSIEGRPARMSRMDIMNKMAAQQFAHENHEEKKGTFTAMEGPGHQLDMFDGMMKQGVLLGPASVAEESVTSSGRCPKSAPVKKLDITAINVEVTLNQWLDYYPGYMFVLTENIEKVREEERVNAEARDKENDPGAVSNGLQGDMIQPLVIRANQGDCVNITLRNETEFEEPVGIHIHGSSTLIKKTGKPAIASNPDTVVEFGESREYEWYIAPDFQEGALTFHSHGDRLQTGLGMVGTFVVEPAGSTYVDPFTGGELKSGWEAMIAHPVNSDFREYVIIYHEVGDESFRPLSKNGEMIPQRDPITDAYRPGARALNFRSEPFGTNNLATQKERFGFEDEAEAYSAYTFGDAGTPIPRGYIGDPSKFRLVHGGSDIFHSHHPHGGTIRWQRDPKAEKTLFDAGRNGPVKFPRMRSKSERVDVQVIGPQTVFDLEPECGAGLCQHLAADFLFHCHVAHHYVAGMWSYWRVYNTLQIPGFQQDIMKPLMELPDRKGKMKPAVDSTQLIGKTVDWFGKKFKITPKKTDWSQNPPMVSINDWVSAMLPVQGQPGHTDDWRGQIMSHDATVLDWAWEKSPKGLLAMAERETVQEWPKYFPPEDHMGVKVGPGGRRKVAFDPKTGKLAWPALQPHFGKRPPFARNHGPAPWLEPFQIEEGGFLQKDNVFNPYSDPGGPGAGGGVSGIETTRFPRPGEQGPWSLCPRQSDNMAQRKLYRIHALGQLPIILSKGDGKNPPVKDDDGLIYVLREEQAEIMANPDLRVPLVYRGNVYDCLDVILTNGWRDSVENGYASKLNIHSHMWQFDNQASDGVISGFSYEQVMRPYKDELIDDSHGLPAAMNEKLSKKAKAGKDYVVLTNEKKAARYHVGTLLGIGMDQVETFEIRRIKKISGKEITFTAPLSYNHDKGEIVSVEFVRYRYYPDADFGTTYWHDHAFGAISWQHGAFGSTIIEPPGSTYHDPKTGDLKRSGYVVDIHTNEPHSIDATGSFRELVLHIQDTLFSTANSVSTGSPPEMLQQAAAAATTLLYPMDKQDNVLLTPNPYINGGTHTTGSALNMRLAPINRRLVLNSDPSLAFSSKIHGDPDTPLLTAYLGDPIMIRNLVTAVNETHTIHVTGHWFRFQRYNPESQPRSTIHIGIAERHDLSIPEAGGAQKMAGDYLYYNGRASKLTEGSWGLIRVLDEPSENLQPLPGKESIPQSAKEVCPSAAPVKNFNVLAVEKGLVLNPRADETIEVDFNREMLMSNPEGKVFVLADEKTKVASAGFQPMPLTLHVNIGDCIKVNLKNELSEGRTSFHAHNLAYDPMDSQGINVGNNEGDQTIGPGESKVYTFYAHPEIGENAALIQDWADASMANQRDGLFGAIIIGPRGSTYRDPVTGEDISLKNSWRADVIVDRGVPENMNRANYRDFSLFFQDEDNILGTSFMPYLQKAAGISAVNYKAEPYELRFEEGCEQNRLFICVSEDEDGDPATPILEAHAGDPVVIHAFGAFSEQNGIFGLEGHQWPEEPFLAGADQVQNFEFGGSEVLNAYTQAGGSFSIPGDYLYMNHRMAYMEAGQWGFLRVRNPGDKKILSLTDTRPRLRAVGVGLQD
ncbi:MAG TPA: multicopper oxidase domain-containing protein [Nitrospiria bacterium]|jgi:FtsP/CotA-like multicopper oxidase with cupredoxin domain